jgi:aspartyl-tRNA synthetase
MTAIKRRGAGLLSRDDIGSRVRLQAWVQRRRDLGGLMFLDLRDRSGVAQVVVRPDEQAGVAETLAPVRAEWVVDVEGEVVARESPNPEMPTGEVEVVADRAAVLARSRPVPFALDAEPDATEETRLRYRFLDLRRPELQRNLMLRDRAALEARKYFHENGFIDLETPILTRSTPEGARDYLVPSRVHRGAFYALPQSPQLFKQLFMVAGFERYVQIARCFRDEDLRADRQPEFTQIDVEMSFVDEEDVIAVGEGLLRRVMPLAGIEPPATFPRLTWADAMARYGSDRPDLRYGLEIADLTGPLGKSAFRGFSAAAAAGGVIRGLALPASTGAGAASRKQVEEWAEVARRHGAAGVLTLRRQDGEAQFQVKGALTPEEAAGAAEALGLEEGGLALLAAGPEATTAAALGAVRQRLAADFGLIPPGAHAFLWVTDFPLLVWDEAEKRWFSNHHPFTSPSPEDLERLESDPGSVRSRAYDAVMDGIELGGGSIRIHDREVQERVFAALGIGPEEARQRFGFLLEALSYGAPPHGGIAFGWDRMVMMMAGASSLREVIAFPKTASATDLMTEAPSPVEPAQLADLGIALAGPRL